MITAIQHWATINLLIIVTGAASRIAWIIAMSMPWRTNRKSGAQR